MKPNFSFLSTLALCSALSACSFLNTKNEKAAVTDLSPVTINSEYSMGIPSFMTKTTSLNDDASLQFQNIFKEAYVIVIDESKEGFVDALVDADSYDSSRSVIENYADTQVQLTTSNMNVITKKDVIPSTINGLNAASAEIDATVEGVKQPISYFLTFVEGKEKLYMIMAWTLQTKKETHRNTFEVMAKTFQTMDTKPVASK
jgi:hypothetical protein